MKTPHNKAFQQDEVTVSYFLQELQKLRLSNFTPELGR